jgi:hypothetical protein
MSISPRWPVAVPACEQPAHADLVVEIGAVLVLRFGGACLGDRDDRSGAARLGGAGGDPECVVSQEIGAEIQAADAGIELQRAVRGDCLADRQSLRIDAHLRLRGAELRRRAARACTDPAELRNPAGIDHDPAVLRRSRKLRLTEIRGQNVIGRPEPGRRRRRPRAAGRVQRDRAAGIGTVDRDRARSDGDVARRADIAKLGQPWGRDRHVAPVIAARRPAGAQIGARWPAAARQRKPVTEPLAESIRMSPPVLVT